MSSYRIAQGMSRSIVLITALLLASSTATAVTHVGSYTHSRGSGAAVDAVVRHARRRDPQYYCAKQHARFAKCKNNTNQWQQIDNFADVLLDRIGGVRELRGNQLPRLPEEFWWELSNAEGPRFHL